MHLDWDSVTWDEFEAALVGYHNQFFHGNPPEEQYYLQAFRRMGNVPLAEKGEQVDELLLFLNRWKCRFSRVAGPTALRAWMERELPALEVLASLDIASPTFPGREPECDRLYESLIDLKRIPGGIHNMSAACASKTLHLMVPALFVMWDLNVQQSSSSRYGRYLTQMHGFAVRLRDELAPADARADLEGYLQRRLDYPVRKPLAKYIDEYNWYVAFGQNRVQLG